MSLCHWGLAGAGWVGVLAVAGLETLLPRSSCHVARSPRILGALWAWV